MYKEKITQKLTGRGTYEITDHVQAIIANSGVEDGLCHVYIHHTSASLIICENADPEVRNDLERFMSKWIPDGHRMFQHRDEGSDDMPAHLRTMLTHTSLTIPVEEGQADLGLWQGIFIYEHRADQFERRVTVMVSE